MSYRDEGTRKVRVRRSGKVYLFSHHHYQCVWGVAGGGKEMGLSGYTYIHTRQDMEKAFNVESTRPSPSLCPSPSSPTAQLL